MLREDWNYKRGDIYLADLGEGKGSEQGGKRPVVVLQNDVGNHYSPNLTIVPLTSKDKKPGQPTHYELKKVKGYPPDQQYLANACRQYQSQGSSAIWVSSEKMTWLGLRKQ